MTRLALFEARRAARNPLLWLGALGLFGIAALNAKDYWPAITEDVGYVHSGLVVLAPFALLVGALVGLRDRVSGAEGLVASTPLRQKGLVVPARMAALTAAASAACVVAFAGAVVLSFARGGRGVPDPFLVVDASLFVALAGCAGFAIGYLTGSRILSLLAAPLLPALNFYLQGTQSGSITHASWLLPSPRLPGHFGPLGYLPDVFPIHSAYLGGGLLTLTGCVWLLAARREPSSSARAGTLTAVAGVLVVVVSAGWLVGQPEEVHVFGPHPSQWVEIHGPGDWGGVRRATQDPDAYADGGLASECAEVDGIEACVFPEYGPKLAEAIAANAAPLAQFASLEGVPQTVRMVPTAEHTGAESCADDDEILVGSNRWSVEFHEYQSVAESGFYCAVFGPRELQHPVANALNAWFNARVSRGLGGKEYVRAVWQGWGRRARHIVGHLSRVEVPDVVARLEPIWDDLRARRASVADLRAALGAPE